MKQASDDHIPPTEGKSGLSNLILQRDLATGSDIIRQNYALNVMSDCCLPMEKYVAQYCWFTVPTWQNEALLAASSYVHSRDAPVAADLGPG